MAWRSLALTLCRNQQRVAKGAGFGHRQLDFPGAEAAEHYLAAFGHNQDIDIGKSHGEANFRHRLSLLLKLVFMFMSELRQYTRVGAVRCADRGGTGRTAAC